jgi:enoyl-CoA hydratase
MSERFEMDFSKYTKIAFERRGRILTCILNDPDNLNSVSGPLHTELADMWVEVAKDSLSDVIVLTGQGRVFSAGGNFNHIENVRKNHTFDQEMRTGKRMVLGALDCDKPVICKLNGDAVGLGATVALFCDIIIAADTARLSDPHVNIGLVAGDGGAIIWPQLMGFARAKHYLFTGDRMTAAEAVNFGLINFAYPADELNAKVEAYADRLASGATNAIRWTKILTNLPLKEVANKLIDPCFALEGMSMDDPDHALALDAIKSRQKPDFGRHRP